MKLSKAQQQVMDRAKAKIDTARSYAEFDTYFEEVEIKNGSYNNCSDTADKFRENNPRIYEHHRKIWEEEKDGIVLTMGVNSRTLYKLQEMGLIEILEDGKNRHFGIDRIKIANY